MHSLNLWLHVLAGAVYLGSTIAVLFSVLPIVGGAADAAERRRLFARGMRAYNPLSIGALGVAIMTGAFNLTDFKAALGKGFAPELGQILAWKLFAVFLLILVATGLSFGIAHRTVREELGDIPIDEAELMRRMDRLPRMLWLAIALAAVVFALGLEMSH